MASDDTADRLLSDYMRSGWTRRLPRNAFTIYDAVLWLQVDEIGGEIEEQPLGGRVGELLAQIGGLRAGIWDEQESDLLRNPDPQEEALLADAKAGLARAEAALGMTVTTNADLVELMRRLGVIERTEEEGEVRWRSADPLPLPYARLPSRRKKSRRRTRCDGGRIHYDSVQSIIRLFVDDDLRLVPRADCGVDDGCRHRVFGGLRTSHMQGARSPRSR